jgi:creatinase
MEQFKIIRNGDKVTGNFSHQEMNRRLDKLRSSMAAGSIDVCLFTSYHNINYFGDFLYCSFGRRYGLVIDHTAVTSISANIDGGQPWRRTSGDNLVYTDWQQDNYFGALKQLIHADVTVGIEFDHVTQEYLRKLQDALPAARFVDVGQTTMQMRMLKSSEEIALIRHGARIADIGGAACVEAAAVGVPEYEVALHGTQAMVRAIAAFKSVRRPTNWLP